MKGERGGMTRTMAGLTIALVTAVAVAMAQGAAIPAVLAASQNAQIPSIIRVAPAGGDFRTLSSALDSITDSSSTRRYLIEVYGQISDAASIGGRRLTAKSYVDVVGYNAEVTVDINTDDDALYFKDVTQATWQNITIKRAGGGSGHALGMYGNSDSSVRFENMRFVNEATARGSTGARIADNVQAVFHNSYFKGSDNPDGFNGGAFTSGQARPTFNNCVFEGGHGGGRGSTGFVALTTSAPILNNSIFRGGSGRQAGGLRAEDQSAPIINGGVAFGGNGPDSVGLAVVFNAVPVINGLIVHSGPDAKALGVWISENSAPVINNMLVMPEQLPQQWLYSTQSRGRFQPFDDKPYMLTSLWVWTQRELPRGTMLKLGTTPEGRELAEIDIGGKAEGKRSVFNRVEVDAGGYMYATPSEFLRNGDFVVQYTVVANNPGTALLMETNGYSTITNSTFMANGASNALELNATSHFEIRNSVFKTLDPATQYALVANQPTTDIPIYNSHFVGRFHRVTTFAKADVSSGNLQTTAGGQGPGGQAATSGARPTIGTPLMILFVLLAIAFIVGAILLVNRLPEEKEKAGS